MPPTPTNSQNAGPAVLAPAANKNTQRRKHDRQRGAAEEEIGDRARS